MNNSQYKAFEAVFEEVARPLLERVRSSLAAHGYDCLSEIVPVDHDVSRGIGFLHTSDDDLYVELMLEDGDAHGFEGVAPLLTCSIFLSGQVWAPYNFTQDVGIVDPAGIAERMESFDPAEVALLIAREWNRVQAERQRIREVA